MDSTIKLASSVLVKYDAIALCINNELIATYGTKAVDQENPLSWKYYRNVCGLYHSTDTIMKVKSLDTQETIIFNKDTLNSGSHNLTREAYRFGSIFYNRLINKYPAQRDLIHGIVLPGDYDTILDVPDMTILNYDSRLVETYEYSLMQKLQEELFGYWRRWEGKNFVLTNDLFVATQVAEIYTNIVKLLLAIRFENALSSQAHSFFIKTKLASCLNMDKYYTTLTRPQLIFLYSNIDYIIAHAGSNGNLEFLLTNLLSGTNLDAYSLDMRQDNEGMIVDGDIYSYTPTPKFKKTSITTGIEKTTQYGMNYVTNLFLNETRDDSEETAEQFTIENDMLTNSSNAKLLTKLITIEPNITESESDYEVNDIALIHWIYWSLTHQYGRTISFQPIGSDHTYSLNNWQAIHLFIYLTSLLNGNVLTSCPEFKLVNIFKKPDDVATTKAKVDMHILPEDEVEAMCNLYPNISYPISGANEFTSTIRAICTAQKKNELKLKSMFDFDKRAFAMNVIRDHYICVYIEGSPDYSYKNFLDDFDVDFKNNTVEEIITMIGMIFTASTGFYIFTSDTIVKQIATIKSLLKKLSSYTTLIATDLNTPNIIVEDVIPILSKNLPSRAELELIESADVIEPTIDKNSYNKPYFTGKYADITVPYDAFDIQLLKKYNIANTAGDYYVQATSDMFTQFNMWVDYLILQELFNLSTTDIDGNPANIGGTGNYWKNWWHENTGNYYFNSTVPCYNFKVRRMSSNGNFGKIYTNPLYTDIGLNGYAIGTSLYLGRLNFNKGTRVAGNYMVEMKYNRDIYDGYGPTTDVPMCFAFALDTCLIESTVASAGLATQYTYYKVGIVVLEFNFTKSGATTTLKTKIGINYNGANSYSDPTNCQKYQMPDTPYEVLITLPDKTFSQSLLGGSIDKTFTLNKVDGIMVATIDGVEIFRRDIDNIAYPMKKNLTKGECEFGYYLSNPYRCKFVQVTQKANSSVIVLNEDFIKTTNTALAGRVSSVAKRSTNLWKKVSSLVTGAAADPDLMCTPYGLRAAASAQVHPHVCYNIKTSENYEIYCLFDTSTVTNDTKVIEILSEFKETNTETWYSTTGTIAYGKYGYFSAKLELDIPNGQNKNHRLSIISNPYTNYVTDSHVPSVISTITTAGSFGSGVHVLKLTCITGKLTATLDIDVIQVEAYIDTQKGGTTSSDIQAKLLYDQSVLYIYPTGPFKEPYPSDIEDLRNYSAKGRSGFVGVRALAPSSNVYIKNLRVTNFFSKDM